MKVIVLGFYDKANLGDEAFKTAFQIIFPNVKFTFVNSDKTDTDVSEYDAAICGAGNLINPYFLDKFSATLKNFDKLKILFGVGVPWPDILKLGMLDDYDYVFTRDKVDVQLIVERTGLCKSRVFYIPDIVFSFPKPIRYHNYNPKIGVFLHRGLTRYYDKTKTDIAEFLNYISKYGKIYFYRFDTSGAEWQDDINANNEVQPLVTGSIQDDTIFTDKEMVQLMANLDYAICARFHAHVMASIAGTPFISLSTTRKTVELMKDLGLSQYQIEFDADGENKATGMDVSKAQYLFDDLVIHKHEISNKLISESTLRREQLKDKKYTDALNRPIMRDIKHIKMKDHRTTRKYWLMFLIVVGIIVIIITMKRNKKN